MRLKYLTAIGFALTLASLFLPAVCFGSIIGDVGALADAWVRMNNFYLLTAVGLWGSSLMALGKMRQGQAFNPFFAKSLSLTLYCIDVVCLWLVVLHFAPEMSAIFNFMVGIFERIFG